MADGGGYMEDSSMSNREKPSTLLPVTIKQAMGAQTDPSSTFTIDGVPLYQVSLVGQIMKADRKPTNVYLELEDGTGRIDVRKWMDSDGGENAAEIAETAAWTEGVYVRVVGSLREMNERKSIVAYAVVPLTDYNEITYHLLSAIHAHLYNLKAAKSAPLLGAGGTFGSGMGMPQFGGSAYQAPAVAKPEYSGVQGDVLNLVKGTQVPEGASKQSMLQSLSGKYGEPAVLQAIASLNDEGLIYTTMDEDHFRAD
mmetsp:Transcript_21925/g.85924  ORF Transcript_21925/g.85924 Transcript_21925/m.85924 type:complete len:254 (+) Transcript_21925:90-851(+)